MKKFFRTVSDKLKKKAKKANLSSGQMTTAEQRKANPVNIKGSIDTLRNRKKKLKEALDY